MAVEAFVVPIVAAVAGVAALAWVSRLLGDEGDGALDAAIAARLDSPTDYAVAYAVLVIGPAIVVVATGGVELATAGLGVGIALLVGGTVFVGARATLARGLGTAGAAAVTGWILGAFATAAVVAELVLG